MDKDRIIEAIHEAERFVKRARVALKRLSHEETQEWQCMGTKEVGAMKRASLDLTRALAELRR